MSRGRLRTVRVECYSCHHVFDAPVVVLPQEVRIGGDLDAEEEEEVELTCPKCRSPLVVSLPVVRVT